MGSTGSIPRESKKGTRNGALTRRCFDRAGESLVVLGKLWIRILYIMLYTPQTWGLIITIFCGAGKGAYCSRLGGASGGARGGALREYGRAGAGGSTEGSKRQHYRAVHGARGRYVYTVGA